MAIGRDDTCAQPTLAASMFVGAKHALLLLTHGSRHQLNKIVNPDQGHHVSRFCGTRQPPCYSQTHWCSFAQKRVHFRPCPKSLHPDILSPIGILYPLTTSFPTSSITPPNPISYSSHDLSFSSSFPPPTFRLSFTNLDCRSPPVFLDPTSLGSFCRSARPGLLPGNSLGVPFCWLSSRSL